MSSLHFAVIGHPGAQGSKRHVGNGVMVESSRKVAPWRQDVIAAATKAAKDTDWQPATGPVAVKLHFYFTRPKAHYRTGKRADELREDAPHYVTSRQAGDLDKLARSTFDALTLARVIADDSQIVLLEAIKTYTTSGAAGATVAIVTQESA